MMTRNKEWIVCAATWYKDLPTALAHGCSNIDKGIVVCALRHANIIAICKSLTGKRTVNIAKDGAGDFEHGFLTSKNRFLNRKEAMELAKKNNQLIDRSGGGEHLFSEDIY